MKKSEIEYLCKIANFLRYQSLRITTLAGSGHPTSSLSASDLMAVLLANFYRYDFKNPDNIYNDRLIFSKGHASPLYYSLFAVCGAIKVKELDTYRKFGSILEGHPTPNFPFTDAATGSLGQGLSVGVGLALGIRQQAIGNRYKKNSHIMPSAYSLLPKVYVLLGDGEMAEGSVWEAAEIASKYGLNNLIAIIDVNKLGQSDETMLGHDVRTYQKRLESFGWETRVIDGHDYDEIASVFRQAQNSNLKTQNHNSKLKKVVIGKPFAIIAKTIKGKGVSFLEGKNGWHGKPLNKEQLEQAVKELSEVDVDLRIKVRRPSVFTPSSPKSPKSLKSLKSLKYKKGDQVATRKAYGMALAKLGEASPNVVALDGDVKNSTYSEIFKEKFPERFFEMYIAEQNMVGASIGFSRMGFIPFISTFSAFLTRAFDQVRMASLSDANIKICGSHAGVSIGEDGPSQMGLEDIAMFRSIFGCSVLYPADAVSTEKLVFAMANNNGIFYLRTSRPATPVIYDDNEKFPIGGCKIHQIKTQNSLRLRSGQAKLKAQNHNLKLKTNKILIIAAGITLFEALKAQKELVKEEIETIVVDCYSIKPIDRETLKKLVLPSFARGPLAKTVGISNVITVEDHYFEGGLGDAVLNVFASNEKVKVYKMAVTKKPRSGKAEELLDFEGISAKAIIAKVKSVI